MVNGGTNTVRLCVASISDFLVMKAHAIKNREKPKDVYDLCYCLEYFPDGINTLAAEWKQRQREQDVALAVTILREKFSDVNAFGPQQLVEFHSTTDTDEADRHSRRASNWCGSSSHCMTNRSQGRLAAGELKLDCGLRGF